MSKRICMLAHSYLPGDNRIFREARALTEKGNEVDIICLKQKGQKLLEILDGIRMIRMPIQRDRTRGIVAYALEYFGFMCLAMMVLWIRALFKRYQIVHVHNPPDFLIWAMLPLKLFGVKAVFDIHDPAPELAMSKWEIGADHFLVKLWRWLEKICVRCADRIIVTNQVDLELIRGRTGCERSKLHIVMNTPDFDNVVNGARRNGSSPQQVQLLYQGLIAKRRGIQTVLQALTMLKNIDKEVVLTIAGEGDYVPILKRQAEILGLGARVDFTGYVDKAQLCELISKADICLIPFLKTPINARGLPNKLFEYITFDKPIVSANLPGITSVVSGQNVWLYRPGSAVSLARTLHQILHDGIGIRQRLATYGSLRKRYNWPATKRNLWSCYASI